MTDGSVCGFVVWFLRKKRLTQLWVELSWVVAITIRDYFLHGTETVCLSNNLPATAAGQRRRKKGKRKKTTTFTSQLSILNYFPNLRTIGPAIENINKGGKRKLEIDATDQISKRKRNNSTLNPVITSKGGVKPRVDGQISQLEDQLRD